MARSEEGGKERGERRKESTKFEDSLALFLPRPSAAFHRVCVGGGDINHKASPSFAFPLLLRSRVLVVVCVKGRKSKMKKRRKDVRFFSFCKKSRK